MKLLAIDTSTDACTVGVMIDDQVLVDHRVAAQQHGTLVLGMVDGLMAQAGLSPTALDALIYGRGPGSFTGVRIGVACAQGIALGADIGVVGISTLQAVAQGCYRETGDTSIAVSIDARMDEVYFCEYDLAENGNMRAVVDEHIGLPTNVPWQSASTWAGSGAERFADIVHRQFSVAQPCIKAGYLPNAQDLLVLGRAAVKNSEILSAENASPVYLRNKVALTTAEREAKIS